MYRLYADASGKYGKLAWAFVLEGPGHATQGSGPGVVGINQTELLAVLEGLARVPPGETVTVHTDSTYVLHSSRKRGGPLRDQLHQFQADLTIKYVKVGAGKGPCPGHAKAHHLAREVVLQPRP